MGKKYFPSLYLVVVLIMFFQKLDKNSIKSFVWLVDDFVQKIWIMVEDRHFTIGNLHKETSVFQITANRDDRLFCLFHCSELFFFSSNFMLLFRFPFFFVCFAKNVSFRHHERVRWIKWERWSLNFNQRVFLIVMEFIAAGTEKLINDTKARKRETFLHWQIDGFWRTFDFVFTNRWIGLIWMFLKVNCFRTNVLLFRQRGLSLLLIDFILQKG